MQIIRHLYVLQHVIKTQVTCHLHLTCIIIINQSVIIINQSSSSIIISNQSSSIINHQSSSIIISNQSSSITNHQSSIIINHQSSSAINHHQSPIINHHQSSSIINHHHRRSSSSSPSRELKSSAVSYDWVQFVNVSMQHKKLSWNVHISITSHL